MAGFKIEFDTDNAAFEDGGKEAEISRILTKIAAQVENGMTSGNILDYNGNTVGKFEAVADAPAPSKATRKAAAPGL